MANNEIHKEIAQITVKKVSCQPGKATMLFEFYCGHSHSEPYDYNLFQSYARSMEHGAVYKRCEDCEEEARATAKERGITYEALIKEMWENMYG
jgi:hypothetical protein